MADDIGQIVEVYVSRETAQIETASFDKPLLMVNLPDTIDNSGGSPVTVPANVSLRVREYTSLKAVGDDFGADSTAYKMAQKLLGNDIRPATFMVGVKNSSETYTEGLQAILAYNDDWYAIAIDSNVEGDIKEVAAVMCLERPHNSFVKNFNQTPCTIMPITLFMFPIITANYISICLAFFPKSIPCTLIMKFLELRFSQDCHNVFCL